LAEDLRTLIRGCLSGDQAAMVRLVDRYRDPVYRLCYRMLGHRQDAEDAAQDGVVRVLHRKEPFSSREEFIAWFKTVEDREVIRRHCLGKFRDLLMASAKSPAMLVYLDNFVNTKAERTIARQLIDELGIVTPSENQKVAYLSGGNQQKVAFARLLHHDVDVLFLDEPTTGIDAVSRVELWDMLKKLKAQNLTILVSTPYMDEANLCDRVAFMQKGEIMEINSPDTIIQEFNEPLYSVKGHDFYHLLLELRQMKITKTAFPFGDSIHLTTYDNLEPFELNKMIEDKIGTNTETQKIKANIEDCFMAKMINSN